MQNVAKNHHYIPRFFLKGFSADDKSLWVFDRYKKEFRLQNIANIASENKLYTYTVNGKEENLEDIFGKAEGYASSIIRKIKRKGQISGQEKADLAMFLALMYVRVPDSKKRIEEGSEKVYKKFNQIVFSNRKWVEKVARKQQPDITEKEIGEVVEFAKDGKRYYVDFPSNHWLGIMLNTSLEVARIFILMDWFVFFFNKKYALITSDNPVCLIPPTNYPLNRGIGLVTQGARKVFALTSSIGLVMGNMNRNSQIIYVDTREKDILRSFNYNAAINSDRFVYCFEKGKLEKLVKDTKIDKYLKHQRVIVN